MMRRREFITLLGGAAAWPLAARAQQPAMPLIGWLGSESREAEENLLIVPFRQGLKEAGYVEGQNLAIEYRVAEGQFDRLPALAADLVRRQVSVIALTGLPAALAAKAATATIPIVFQVADDPVQVGLVASLGRPGNITGVTSLNVEVVPKQLQLLHELVPSATAMAFIVNPANSARAASLVAEAQGAARRLAVKLYVLHGSTERELDAAFAKSVELRAGAIVIAPDSFFFNLSQSGQLSALAARHVIPAIYPYREFAASGGLMSYGTNPTNLFRQLGIYVSRILKGEKPADLPVQQPVKLELIINLKTARALGLEVPMSMLMRVDEIIE